MIYKSIKILIHYLPSSMLFKTIFPPTSSSYFLLLDFLMPLSSYFKLDRISLRYFLVSSSSFIQKTGSFIEAFLSNLPDCTVVIGAGSTLIFDRSPVFLAILFIMSPSQSIHLRLTSKSLIFFYFAFYFSFFAY